MLVARLGLFTFNRKFSYFIYMHQRMGNGAGSTDLTNFFSSDDFWSTLLLYASPSWWGFTSAANRVVFDRGEAGDFPRHWFLPSTLLI